MNGSILELKDTLFIPVFKKIVSLSNLLDQGYEVKETHLKILCNDKTIAIKCKPNHWMLYLISFIVKPEVYAAETIMDINKAHEKLGHVGKDILCKTMNFALLS